LPPIAEADFHLAAKTAVLSFIVVFGVTKALTNYLAGRLSDRFGRKHVLIGGWLVAAPVPFLLMWAPSWAWMLFANALLGVSQGLTWSTTVIMKIDLAGPHKRGLAMGLNEFAGYVAVAGSALATGFIAAHYGLRPQPFYLGIAFVVSGLLLSTLAVRDTTRHVNVESKLRHEPAQVMPTQREVFWKTTLLDRNLSSVSLAGLINNLNDGMAWGLFPLFFLAARMDFSQIGTLAAIYPATWGIGQLFTGSWSDRVGRKWLIAAGMWVQAVGIGAVVLASGFLAFAVGAAVLGIGTAMVYPTLLAAIGDVAHPSWRASSVGVYRLWRDLGYAVGALFAGVAADAFGLPAAMWFVAATTFLSGVVVSLRMTETLHCSSGPAKTVPTCIEPADLRSLSNAIIVDVCLPEEFAAAHVAGAINIPLDALPQRASLLPKDAMIVTVCGKGGRRSERAARQLRALGVGSARALCGGTRAWMQTSRARG
jgi:MFS family permease